MNQKSIKCSVVDEFLASRVVDDYKHLSFNFLDENLVCYTRKKVFLKKKGNGNLL